jgi:GR25 family glycosyltransferase involved in LPS biosynthesis
MWYIMISISLFLVLALVWIYRPWFSKRPTIASSRQLLRSKWKSGFDANEFIDLPVIYINLEKSQDRRLHMREEFNSLRLNPSPVRLEAVKGQLYLLQPWTETWIDPSLHDLHKNFIGDRTPAELGCLLSHIKALLHVYLSKHRAALILEDDIDFSAVGLWGESLSSLVQRVPADWDFIQLHRFSDDCLCAEDKKKKKLVPHPRSLYKKTEGTTCWGTQAYLVSARAAERFYKRFFKDGLLSQEYFWSVKSNPTLNFSSDSVLYRILDPSNVYLEELNRFFPLNDQLESTIHPQDTPDHIMQSEKALQKYLDLARMS